MATKINGVLTYSSSSGTLLTDSDFYARRFKYKHQNPYVNGKSPLERLNISMVSQVPLDCMYLVDLGVMRKFLLRIVNNNILIKVSKENIDNISKKLLDICSYIPKEFARKPRSLTELNYWKATEYRQFLLYTGIVVLKDNIDEDIYYEFLVLHCAYRMLCCPKHSEKNLETAQDLLNNFVENFPPIFGENSISCNVHNLLHIKSTVQQVGNPVKGSAYAFENFLQKIKKVVKQPSKILEQTYKNLEEEKFLVSIKPDTYWKQRGTNYNTNFT